MMSEGIDLLRVSISCSAVSRAILVFVVPPMVRRLNTGDSARRRRRDARARSAYPRTTRVNSSLLRLENRRVMRGYTKDLAPLVRTVFYKSRKTFDA